MEPNKYLSNEKGNINETLQVFAMALKAFDVQFFVDDMGTSGSTRNTLNFFNLTALLFKFADIFLLSFLLNRKKGADKQFDVFHLLNNAFCASKEWAIATKYQHDGASPNYERRVKDFLDSNFPNRCRQNS